MEKQIIIDKIKSFYSKYDDYIKYNFYILLIILFQNYTWYIIPSILFSFTFPAFAIPLLIGKYYKNKNIKRLKYKLFSFFILMFFSFGWHIKYNIFKIQFLEDVYLYFLSSFFIISILIINFKINIKILLFNLTFSFILNIIVYFIAIYDYGNYLGLGVSIIILLSISQYIQIFNTLIFYERNLHKNNESKVKVTNSKSQFKYKNYLDFHNYIKYLALICFFITLIYITISDTKEIENKKQVNKFQKFVNSNLETRAEIYKVNNKMYKLKYDNDYVIFYIIEVYNCRNNKYPNFFINLNDLERLQISKDKGSDRFSFKLNGQCVEAKVSLSY